MTSDPSWACAQMVSRFFRSLDEGREADGAAMFTEDGVWVRRGTPIIGREAIVGALRERPESRISRHLVSNIVVDPDDRGMKASYYVTIFSVDGLFEGTPPLDAPVMMLVCEDRLVETPEGWRFVSRSSKMVFAK